MPIEGAIRVKIFRWKFGCNKSHRTFAQPNGTAQRNAARKLSDGVTGNTLDFDSRESRFEPWSDN